MIQFKQIEIDHIYYLLPNDEFILGVRSCNSGKPIGTIDVRDIGYSDTKEWSDAYGDESIM